MCAVPCQQRLSCCALVSTSWAAAAVVATQEMLLVNFDDVNKVQTSLSSSFSGITALELDSIGPKQQVLTHLPPLRKLKDLQLLHVAVQLGPACGHPGILQAAPGVTHLLLQDVTLAHGLEALSVLTGLCSLSVTGCSQHTSTAAADGRSDNGNVGDGDAAAAAAEDANNSGNSDGNGSKGAAAPPVPVPGSIFAWHLLHLTHLELRGGLSEGSLQHISRLTLLDSLAIDFEGSSTTPAALIGLDKLQQLTFLALTDTDISISSDTVPGLSKLTGLQALWLFNCRSISPSLLAPLTKLQHLDLDGTAPAGGVRGVTALLSVLPRLQHLTHLDLCDCLASTMMAGEDSTAAAAAAQVPAAAFSALTASSCLAFLDIQGADLPQEAWQHLLLRRTAAGSGPPAPPAAAAAVALSHLQRLHLADAYSSSCPEGLHEQRLQQLVQACPNLRNLQGSLPPPEEEEAAASCCPSALLQLSGLTGLALDGISTDVAESVLVKLTQLEELHCLPHSTIEEAGLLLLTALTRLSQLGIHHHHDTCCAEFQAEYSRLAVKDGNDLVLLFNVEVRMSSMWQCVTD